MGTRLMRGVATWLDRRWVIVRKRGTDRGSGGGMSLFLTIGSAALIVVIGLVYDGGLKAQALDRAERVASEAARAALQAAPAGGVPSRSQAKAVIEQFIATENAASAGTESVRLVSLEIVGNSVQVTVEATKDTVFLGMIGVDQWDVTGTGAAEVQFN